MEFIFEIKGCRNDVCEICITFRLVVFYYFYFFLQNILLNLRRARIIKVDIKLYTTFSGTVILLFKFSKINISMIFTAFSCFIIPQNYIHYRTVISEYITRFILFKIDRLVKLLLSPIRLRIFHKYQKFSMIFFPEYQNHQKVLSQLLNNLRKAF